jgi:uncharacterized protein YecT (DUF1311 family)
MRKYLTLLAAIVIAIYLFSISPSVVASQAGKAYAEADDRLNTVYRELTATIKNSGDRSRLTVAEQAWIKFRNAEVNFYGRYYPNSKEGLFLKTKLTEDRATYLLLLLQASRPNQGDDTGPI